MSWTIGAIYTCAVCGKDAVGHVDVAPLVGHRLVLVGEPTPPWGWRNQGGADGISVCNRCRDKIANFKWPGAKHEPHVEG